jgi:hypothetical protein
LNSRGSASAWFCIKLSDKDSTFEVRYTSMFLHFEVQYSLTEMKNIPDKAMKLPAHVILVQRYGGKKKCDFP